MTANNNYTSSLRARAGFTLIELLVTVGIFSMIAAGLAGVLMSGINIWQKAQTISFSRQDMFLELENLSRRVRQNITITDIPFLGTPTEMEFPILINGRIIKAEYVFDSSAKTLSYKEAAYEDILAGESEVAVEKTSFEADELTFSYLVFDGESSYFWKDNADAEHNVPSAVKLNITLDEQAFEKIIFLPGNI